MSSASYRRFILRLLSVAAGLAFTGGPVCVLGAAEGDAAPVQQDYILQPLDRIKVEIFQEPDLTREIKLSQDAAATLPLIGTVNLRGKSVLQAETLLRVLYDRDYLVNPQINISVLEYAKQTVDVLGAVAKAGSIDIPPEQPLNLLGAIARAGGFTRLADRRKVKLTRNEDGKAVTYDINADDIIQSNSSQAWLLRTGDVIYVPERLL